MKLCLAGFNSIREGTYPLLKDIPFILESYAYMRDYEIPLIHTAELFLLDSGAFTFISNPKKKIDWDEYLTGYINFINEHDVKYFFELDIDVVVGYEKVKEFRRRLERETGKKCIPVWHENRGIEDYKQCVAEYDYIALGSSVTTNVNSEKFDVLKKMLAYARKNGTKVHGLGRSEPNIHEYGFYSVDSTTWNMISRFGKVYKFTGDRIKVITPRGKRIDKSKYIEAEVYNLKEWIKYQNYLRRF